VPDQEHSASRADLIANLSDPNLSIEQRRRACEALSDLHADEPEFEVATHALLRIANGAEPLRDVADAVLSHVNERRATEAHHVFVEALARDLPPGTSANDSERLLALFQDDAVPWEQRRAACRLLGESNSPGAQAALVQVFFGSDADLAFEAANALFAIKSRVGRPLRAAVEPLTAALRSAVDPEMKEAAIFALGRIGGADATPVLVEVLESRVATSGLRVTALQGLAFTGPRERVRPRIIEALADVDPAVRIAAIGLVVPEWPGVPEALRKMASDKSQVSGFGTVAENAAKKLEGN
jgi:HEAT repeat protein